MALDSEPTATPDETSPSEVDAKSKPQTPENPVDAATSKDVESTDAGSAPPADDLLGIQPAEDETQTSSQAAASEPVGDNDDAAAVESGADTQATDGATSDDSSGETSPTAEAENATNQPVVPAKPSFVSKTIRGVRSNLVLIIASAASLLVGFLGSMFLGGSNVVEEAIVDAPVRYVAALSHRNEPLGPLVPFEDLDPVVVDLGKRLFHDAALSGNGKIACASCHDVDSGGDDGLKVSVGPGNVQGRVNTPSILNAALNFAQFWDGRVDTLEKQLDDPIQSPAEMNSDWSRIVKYVRNNRRYNDTFVDVLGGNASESRIREAIATYERSLITLNSSFDQWLAGDEQALTPDQFSGYYLFKQMNCVSCHNGASVGGNTFRHLGGMKEYFSNGAAENEADLGRFNVTGDEQDRFVFRVPQLRNAALTAPYFHDGSAETLHDAVSAMVKHQAGQEPKSEDVAHIVAFLESLTGEVPTPPELPKPSPTS